MKNGLTFALPKGTLFPDTVRLLYKAGFLKKEEVLLESRKLVIKDGPYTFIICRPTDIPTFVEHGAADLGIVGKDVIEEQRREIFELLDLKYGKCHFAVAAPRDNPEVHDLGKLTEVRAASKFPEVTRRFFKGLGVRAEVIKMHGNVELAPLVGLADVIVDLVSTGRTLRENNLIEITKIMDITARLVANRVAARVYDREIKTIVKKFKSLVGGEKNEVNLK
ncbi:ATP phosphoribosyltransferase [Carboxydothermus islandicus]|uniref:ATP phosphoribosyltransferase n=1 Tax=Carboxydothermus islandicus TaxID=661089 RepID=A0A1L8D520_9THEO|nr:ATP phosphoribosyltransferase [Carboxydothermus islandicus]GAV26248.1 ATP phosphoribosyltransferase [Carboxydothermus islandicus]